MMETMIPPQVGMRLRTKKNKKIKRERPKKEAKKRKNNKIREKEKKREGTMLLSLFPHLCFEIAP